MTCMKNWIFYTILFSLSMVCLRLSFRLVARRGNWCINQRKMSSIFRVFEKNFKIFLSIFFQTKILSIKGSKGAHKEGVKLFGTRSRINVQFCDTFTWGINHPTLTKPLRGLPHLNNEPHKQTTPMVWVLLDKLNFLMNARANYNSL